ncbi:MAG: winged helix-turn-helix domain-containing protein [Terriglobales bacterium]
MAHALLAPAPSPPALYRARYRFGPFLLCPFERALWQITAGQALPVSLTPRALDLLIELTSQAGQIVAREQLIERVWRGVNVQESNLNVHLCALRRALGQGRMGVERYIATVPGRGYQFVAPVAIELAPGSLPMLAVAEFASTRRTRGEQALAIALASGLVVRLAEANCVRLVTASAAEYVVLACCQQSGSAVRVTARIEQRPDGQVHWAAQRDFQLGPGTEARLQLQDAAAAWLAEACQLALR